jgi:hypothetical protein
MPPVSVTMQPRNLPAVAAWLDDDFGVLELELGALVADPQAASSAAVLTAATAISVAFTGTSKVMAASAARRTCDVTSPPTRSAVPGISPQGMPEG